MQTPNDPHPTVQACVLRSFCDATFAAAERRMDELHRLDKELERLRGELRDRVGDFREAAAHERAR